MAHIWLEAHRRGSLSTSNTSTKSDNLSQDVDTKTVQDNIDALDGGWGWVVTFGAFIINVIVDGIIYSFGLFFIELYEYYDASKSQTAWISSTAVGLLLLSGIFSSVLISLFGTRLVAMSGGILSALAIFVSTWSPNVPVMIVLYGILGGLGLGFMYLTCIVAVCHYFTRRRALATGIALSGSGVGSISFAPLLEFLISSYGWKGAMWILSGICFNGVAMGALLRPKNPGQNATMRLVQKLPSGCRRTEKEIDSGETSRHTCDWSSLFAFALLKQLSFLIYAVSNGICLLCFFTPLTFLPDHAKENGITSSQIVFLISAMAVANSVSRLVMGWVADQPWANIILIRSFIFITVGAATCCVPYYKTFVLLIIYAVVTGATIGVYMSLLSIITIELVGIDKLNPAFGLVTLFMSVAAMVSSPLGGALADAYGNYNASFYFAGSMLIFAGAISLPLRNIMSWEQGRMGSLWQSVDGKVTSEKMMVECISVTRIQQYTGYDNFSVLNNDTSNI